MLQMHHPLRIDNIITKADTANTATSSLLAPSITAHTTPINTVTPRKSRVATITTTATAAALENSLVPAENAEHDRGDEEGVVGVGGAVTRDDFQGAVDGAPARLEDRA